MSAGAWLEGVLLAYLVNAAWQAGLVVAAGAVAARLVRGWGAAAEHRVWVGALVLAVGLPLCGKGALLLVVHGSERVLGAAAVWLGWAAGRAEQGGGARVQVSVAAGVAAGGPALSSWVAAVLVGGWGVLMLVLAARLVWQLREVSRVVRQAAPVEPSGEAAGAWARCRAWLVGGAVRQGRDWQGRDWQGGERQGRELLGGGRLGRGWGSQARLAAVRLAESPAFAVPVVAGFGSPVLLVPLDFLGRVPVAEVETAFAHECAHLRRGDLRWGLVLRLLGLPLAWHPATWLLRRALAHTREMACDEMAAGALGGGDRSPAERRERYTRSLLRLSALLAERAQPVHVHAIGIFDANTLERRVMRLTEQVKAVSGVRKLVLAGACVLVAVATATAAVALRVGVHVDDASAPAAQKAPAAVQVSSGVMAANIETRMLPKYPAEAKQNHDKVNGTVVLSVVISKEGVPTDVQVKKSLRPDYDESALTAVRQWRWKPYLLNGEPVVVESEVNITYSLDTDEEPAKEPAAASASTDGSYVPPRVVSAEDPSYPAAVLAKKEKFAGICVVGLTVSTDGLPEDVHVVKSLRADFDEQALAAVRTYRFKPATEDGAPVAKAIKIEVNFQQF